METCSIDGCDGKRHARGWCRKHYNRWYRHGDPLCVLVEHREPGTTVDLEYIFSQCVVDEHGCWIWQRGRNGGGYGHIKFGGKTQFVHRVVRRLDKGLIIPEGMHVLHKCFRGKFGCCNPGHLKIGTHADNMNDWDCSGERHGNAVVPDCIKNDTVRRYRETEHLRQRHPDKVTQQALADELTAEGYPTHQVTVCYWCRGTTRNHALYLAMRQTGLDWI